MVFFLARMILISHLKVGFHIFNPFWLHSSSMAKVAFEGFCVDRSWSLPVSGAHLHRCSALGETFLQFCQTLPLPALLKYLWFLFRQLPQFCCFASGACCTCLTFLHCVFPNVFSKSGACYTIGRFVWPLWGSDGSWDMQQNVRKRDKGKN